MESNYWVIFIGSDHSAICELNLNGAIDCDARTDG